MKYFLFLVTFFIFGCESHKEESPCSEAFAKMYYAKEDGHYKESLVHVEEYGKCVLEGHDDYDMPYYYHKGWALYGVGEYQKAIDTYNLGMKVQKDYPFAHFRRGEAYEALGNVEAAELDYEITYKLGMGYDPEGFTKMVTETPFLYAKLKKYIELNKPQHKDAAKAAPM